LRAGGALKGFVTIHDPFQFARFDVHQQTVNWNARADERALPDELDATKDVWRSLAKRPKNSLRFSGIARVDAKVAENGR